MRACPHCDVELDEARLAKHEERCGRRRFDVVCGCGWELLQVKEDDIPPRCPQCGYRIRDAAAQRRDEENEGRTLDIDDFSEDSER